MNRLNLLDNVSECTCKICSAMCKRPCWGTPDEIQKLIDAGYKDRLMRDFYGKTGENDVSYVVHLVCPANKGYEGKEAPFVPRTEDGCTFWKNGLCELHEKGLKPLVGKVAHHDLDNAMYEKMSKVIIDSWRTEEGKRIVNECVGEHSLPAPTIEEALNLMSKFLENHG